jgi:hypothetical protein
MSSPRERYRAWIDAIFDYCFPPGGAGQLVALSFDDDAKRSAAALIGAPPDEFEELTRLFARPSDSDDAFRFWRPVDDDAASYPTYVGILAAIALAASRVDYGASSSSGGFHRAFNDIIGSTSGSRWTAGFESLTRYWKRLAEYLEYDCAGDRGVLILGGDHVYRGGRHVAAAMVQILVSRGDLASLMNYFVQRFGRRTPLEDEAFIRVIEDDVLHGDEAHYGFPVVLRRRYKMLLSGMAVDDRTLVGKLREVVRDAYSRWLREQRPESLRRATPSHTAPGSSVVRVNSASGNHCAGVVRLRDGTMLRRNGVQHSAEPEVKRDTVSIDLGLDPGFGPRPWTLCASARYSSGNVSTCTISVRPNDAEVLDLVTTDGRQTALTVPRALMFELDANDMWIRVNRLSPDHEGAVLVQRLKLDAVARALRTVDGKLAIHAMTPPLDGYALIRLHAGPLTEREAQRNGLVDIIATHSAYVWPSGGLQVRGMYLSAAPPRVHFSRAGVSTAEVFLDGVSVGFVANEAPFALNGPLQSGIHRVLISDGYMEFSVTDDPVSSDLDRDDTIGWELSRPASLVRALRAPGSQPPANFRYAGIRLVTGGIVE